MIDNVLAESHHPILSVGSRRGALAGILAGVAGVQAAQGRKKDRPRKKGKNAVRTEKKRKGKGKKGGQLPTVILVENSNNVSGVSGLVSGSAECPSGFVAIGAGFTIVGADATGLVGQDLENSARKWNVRFNVPDVPVGNASIEVVAVCLKAKLLQS
jgi:hypothetical protein